MIFLFKTYKILPPIHIIYEKESVDTGVKLGIFTPLITFYRIEFLSIQPLNYNYILYRSFASNFKKLNIIKDVIK